MSLLRGLWVDTGGEGGDGEEERGGGRLGEGTGNGLGNMAEDPLASKETALRTSEILYAQAVSSSSSGDRRQRMSTASKSLDGCGPKMVGTKRPRSPRSPTCGCCFRTSGERWLGISRLVARLRCVVARVEIGSMSVPNGGS